MAAVITVNSVLDTDVRDGVLTLREAIEINNRTLPQAQLTSEERALVNGVPTSADTDTIAFNTQASGAQTIGVTSALPTITDPVIIDGYTQPGASANTLTDGDNAVLLIELNGSNAGTVSGLQITAGASTVKGLVINRFSQNAIALFTSGGNVVQGNFLGTDASGTVALRNGRGVLIGSNSNGNTIGGAAAGARNVISGNNSSGIEVDSATGTVVQGNFIGTNAAGTAALGNTGQGVFLDASPNTTVAGNVISGTTNGDGIYVQSITGNSGVVIQGNRVGTSAAGTAALGNASNGIFFNGVDNARIGGTAAGAGNVISGNAAQGILVSGSLNLIQGNFIGTDITGAVALGNALDGIDLIGSSNTVGGPVAAAGNVISGNRRDGIAISSSGQVVQGNLIGTAVDGKAPLGNLGSGVLVTNSSGSKNTIGGIAQGSGNIIGFNAGAGVFINGGPANGILGNSMFANGGLGIDLGFNGVTPNDPGDGDAGPNNLQNFPELTSASLSGTTLTVTYVVPSTTGNSAYPLRVEFFKADAGGTEGQSLLGVDTYSANDAGKTKTVSFTPSSAAALTAGDRLVATATDATINTSEFSAAAAVAIPLQIHTPTVTSASTTENTQTTSGLVIGRNPADAQVTHFQITGITNGTLFQNDGVTPIKNGDFITVDQGSKGLRFTPTPHFVGAGTFNVQSSVSNTTAGLGGGIATATIAITAAGGFDFGDAPDSYHTLLVSNGPRHALGSALFLGKAITAEPDGKPGAAATADSGDDGVTLPTRLVAGLDAVATVVASAPGMLDAWIDFNRNGVFDAAEQIAFGLPVVAGANTIKFNVPPNATSGTTYARFRLSSAGGLAPTGAAPDGEIEDYAVPIVVTAAGTAVLIDDPAAPGKKVLVVTATTQTDRIQIQLRSTVLLCKNGCKIAVYSASSVGRVVVLGLDGNDTVQVDPRLKVPVQVHRRRRP